MKRVIDILSLTGRVGQRCEIWREVGAQDVRVVEAIGSGDSGSGKKGFEVGGREEGEER